MPVTDSDIRQWKRGEFADSPHAGQTVAVCYVPATRDASDGQFLVAAVDIHGQIRARQMCVEDFPLPHRVRRVCGMGEVVVDAEAAILSRYRLLHYAAENPEDWVRWNNGTLERVGLDAIQQEQRP